MEHNDFMKEAIRLAEENATSGLGGPFGAVVVKDGKIIATGVNTVTGTNDPTAHAEVNAIRNACKALSDYRLIGCDLYSSCEPCPMCFGAIYWARFRKVFYAATRKEAAQSDFDDSFIYDEINLPFNERTIPFEHIPHPDSIKPFRKWDEHEGKKRY
ncbi:MAG: nucleoside deaminase [Bacteroidetes bacterium]|nr:nucleoside deaminase [Bacteroidota bacterium]